MHQEPPEARKPSQMWRLYGFKNGTPSSSSSDFPLLLLLFPLLFFFFISFLFFVAVILLLLELVLLLLFCCHSSSVFLVSCCTLQFVWQATDCSKIACVDGVRLRKCDSFLLSKSASWQELQASQEPRPCDQCDLVERAHDIYSKTAGRFQQKMSRTRVTCNKCSSSLASQKVLSVIFTVTMTNLFLFQMVL